MADESDPRKLFFEALGEEIERFLLALVEDKDALFDYVKDPLPVLAKMRQSVDGRAILSFPRRWTWRAPVRKARLALKGCDVYFYTAGEIERLKSGRQGR